MTLSSFSLLDEPWVPVQKRDGTVGVVGLRDVFKGCHDLTGLAETAPPSLVAQYRLMLAIVHRALSSSMPQGWTEKDRARWHAEGLPIEQILTYLQKWEDRFWLFHPTHPFLQVAELGQAPETKDKRKPWAQISLASASGDAPLLFDHSCDTLPSLIQPDEAVRTLVGFLQFVPGGLVKVFKDSDKAGPLSNTAAILSLGDSLSQTLVLNLHPSPGRQASPDLPAWERPALLISDLKGSPVLATGPNDRYSRQSRAVLLLKEDSGIQWVRFGAGLGLEEDPAAPDPMASYRAGSKGLVRLSFDEGRSVWRDLPALLPNPGGNTQAAAVLQWSLALQESTGNEDKHMPLLVAGVSSDQAKILRWRIEQLHLPLALLENPSAVAVLRELISQVDELFWGLKKSLVKMVAQTLPSPDHKDTMARARQIVETGPVPRGFYSFMGQRFQALPGLLEQEDPEPAIDYWTQALREAAKASWETALADLGQTSKTLKGAALSYPAYFGALNKHAPLPASNHQDS